MTARSVLWLRRDLRRADLPALAAAAAEASVVPLYVLDPRMWHRAGPTRRAWVAANVRAAAAAYDGAFCVRIGDPRRVVPEVAAECGARAVHVTRETTPLGRARDEAVSVRLAERGIALVATGTPYAVGPGIVRTRGGGPFQVFTPFARAWREVGWPAPAREPRGLVLDAVDSDPAAHAALAAAVAASPVPLPPAGQDAASRSYRSFVQTHLAAYDSERDRPDLDSTSRLSPYLKVGAIHPRTILAGVAGRRDRAVDRFVTELAWREFYADVLWHHPASATRDLRSGLAGLEYDEVRGVTAERVAAWREGRTGYPFVDAGMRQLLAQGWMHNRVRMVVASFLTKDLHVWWPVGARHFLDHLLDADVASNSHGWQWVAGTGTDAAPYVRVFNPVAQGLRFDPEGVYVRRHVPELAHLPGAAAHEPWRHPDGYRDGYPPPVVEHDQERRDALARYAAARP